MWFLKRHGIDRSAAAVANASRAMTQISKKDQEIKEVTKSMRHFRRENHIAEQITNFMTRD